MATPLLQFAAALTKNFGTVGLDIASSDHCRLSLTVLSGRPQNDTRVSERLLICRTDGFSAVICQSAPGAFI